MTAVPVFEIPLSAAPQKFTVQLNKITYSMTVRYLDVDQGGWVLDIADINDVPMVGGIPLVTGADLLAQYGYLDIGGQLFVQSDADPDSVPTFENLGSTSHLYWLPN